MDGVDESGRAEERMVGRSVAGLRMAGTLCRRMGGTVFSSTGGTDYSSVRPTARNLCSLFEWRASGATIGVPKNRLSISAIETPCF